MDADALNKWVREVRELLAAEDRLGAGDTRIGHVLWWSPMGADGEPPHESVRDLIETLASEDLEAGFHAQAINSRCAHFMDPEGGRVEREFASEYRKTAEALRDRWPRTAALFESLAESWEYWARRRDDEVALRHDEQQALGAD